ncbi:hypothetical protein NESM_000795800 [Novymonas esmeraldas]|uniref:RecQ-mediated genome instability protein 1 n=1 Tax=Novymonas esmeraldas TaxID=1808958 RepID=A0AAW0EY07_9TRYP
MTALVDEVRERYSLSLSTDYVERCGRGRASLTSLELYQRALRENLRDICGASLLPYGVAAQVSATLPSAVVMQINASRDATQPLRPCADTSDEEVALTAAFQRNSDKRLLRLQLTDGNTEIPALELSTLRAFTGIPIPGEKLLIHKDAEVRHGCIILSEDNVSFLGGEVPQLRQDYLAHRRRLEVGYQTSGGLDGAPRFAPLDVGQHHCVGGPSSAGLHMGPVPPHAYNGGGAGHGHHVHHSGGGGTQPPISGGYDQTHSRGGGGGGGYGGRGRSGRDGGHGGRGGASGHQRGGGHGRGRGDGGRGGGHYGGGGTDGTGSYHVDTVHFQVPAERFPAIHEANFPRLV